jgi:hypothetical protein
VANSCHTLIQMSTANFLLKLILISSFPAILLNAYKEHTSTADFLMKEEQPIFAIKPGASETAQGVLRCYINHTLLTNE